MATTPNYGWVMPDPTDLVTNLPADFEVFGDAVDADLSGLLGGTTGQVLIKDSNDDHDFSWGTAAAGGLTLITSGTLSGSSILFSSIPTTYKDLRLVIRNYLPSNDGGNILIRFLDDSGANRHVTNTQVPTETSIAFNGNDGAIVSGQDNATSQSLVILNIYDYANTTTFKFSDTTAIANNSTTSANINFRQSYTFYNQTSAVTSFRISVSGGGSYTSGDYFLFGVN
jgi:hypothetical protein